MKQLTSIVTLLISFVAFGQQMTYTEWQSEAITNIRLQPKYGNAQKTPAQIKADNELIADYLAQTGTRYKGSELLVKLGFDYLYKGDLKTAMYRFNQAWLLDPKNANVFWGFGAIYFTFQDFAIALQQYEEGLLLNAQNSNIITDQASIYLANFQVNNVTGDLATAINLFEKSLRIDSKNQNTLFKLSACYYLKNDCKNALKYYKECEKLGGKPITTEYTNALNQLCKK